MKCRLCQAEAVERLGEAGRRAVSVTSDVKLCDLPAVIYACSNCQLIQKHPTELAQRAVAEIYARYDGHHLSGGNEQVIFPEGLEPRTRTYHALEQCRALLPERGHLLDVGSGNGAVLKSAATLLPQWDLHAFDITSRYQAAILGLPRVVSFTSGALENVVRKAFDLIVLWHAFEHVPEPVDTLRQVRAYLNPTGRVLLQVPDLTRTPFDLAVIDHYSHFGPDTLARAVQMAGFEIVRDGTDWTHNCLTLLLAPRAAAAAEAMAGSPPKPARAYFDWLNQTVAHYERLTYETDYILFGTGMASTWLLSQLSHPPVCLMDEDHQRAGRQLRGIPICLPADAPPDLAVVMPFLTVTAEKIRDRLQSAYAAKAWRFWCKGSEG